MPTYWFYKIPFIKGLNMKYLSLLLCGLLVNAYSFSCASPRKKLNPICYTTNPNEGYSKKEIMAIYADFAPIIGTQVIEDTFNAMTGSTLWNDIPGFQQYYLPIDKLNTFTMALMMAPPIPCLILVTSYFGTFASIVAGKAIYAVAKDITKGAYIITKDGIIALKGVAKDSAKIAKKMHAFLFKKNNMDLQNNESSSLKKA